MNKQLKRRTGAVLCALFLTTGMTFAQMDNFDFLRSTPGDALKFIQAYINPWTNAFGAGLNGGWYNTAKPHKLLGFDLTTSVNVGVVPASADKFDLSAIGLSSSIAASGLTPSVSGPDINGQHMSYRVNGQELASFDAPAGTAWKYIPAPTAQLGLGLPFGTEIKGRFIPKINIQDGDVSLWGIGLMHNLTQYLPGDKLLPFDVSLFGGYTKLTGNLPLDVQPGSPQNYTAPYNASTSFQDQNLNLTMSALNISAIASLNIPVLTIYGGLGYSKTTTAIQLQGNFPTPVLVSTGTPHSEYNNSGVKTAADFPKIEMNNFSGVRANIGLRIKLAVITIHADYTRAQYNVFSTGLGISVR